MAECCVPAFIATVEICPATVDVDSSVYAPRPSFDEIDVAFGLVPAESGVSFIIGSPASGVGRSASSKDQVEVTLSRPFFMQQTGLTQQRWDLLMGVRDDR
ncbi:MAG: hypothetical protein ACJAYU_001718 [Bradymonadia bacterium]